MVKTIMINYTGNQQYVCVCVCVWRWKQHDSLEKTGGIHAVGALHANQLEITRSADRFTQASTISR